MAYFPGDGSYLSVAALANIGTGKFQYSFKITTTYSGVQAYITHYAFGIAADGHALFLTSEGLLDSGVVINNGVEHTITAVRNAGGITTLTVDANPGVSTVGVDTSDHTLLPLYIGGADTGGIQAVIPMTITEFRVYGQTDVLELDLPLTEDLQDHSGKGVAIVSHGIVLGDNPTYMIVGNVGSVWTNITSMVPSVVFGSAVSSGGTNIGYSVHFPKSTPIPKGSIISSAILTVNASTVSGTAAKGRIVGHADPNSTIFTSLVDYQTRRGSEVGGAGSGTLTTAVVTYDDQIVVPGNAYEIDVKTIIQELVALDDVTGIALFFDDHAGRSSGDNYIYWTNANTLDIVYGPASCTITYNSNGATGSITDPLSPYDYNDTVTVLESTGLSKENFVFERWNTQANGLGTDYTPSSTFSITENITLYAIWVRRYKLNQIAVNNHLTYSCILEHNGTADTEPGVGVNWRTYWGQMTDYSNHSDLYNLQGGDSTAVEFYHLPFSSYSALTDVNAQLENLQTDGSPTFNSISLTTGAEIGKVLTSDARGNATWETPTGGSAKWTLVPALNYTATPASTSTLTMLSDMTASILVGLPLRYTISAVEYFGICTAITSGLLTIAGAPLSGNVSNLKYGDSSCVVNNMTIIYGAYEDADNTDLIETDLKTKFIWDKVKSYLVCYKLYSYTADGSGNGKATVQINNTDVNTSADGLTIVAAKTWYSTVVDIATAAYDINPGEEIEIAVKKGTGGDASDLTVKMIFVIP